MLFRTDTDTSQDDMAAPVPSNKRQRFSLLARPLAVTEFPELSAEAKSRYFNRLTALWAVHDSCPRGSIGHTDATKDIIAVTKELRRDGGNRSSPVIRVRLMSTTFPASSPCVTDPADPARAAADAALRRLQSTDVQIQSDSEIPAQAQSSHAAALDANTAAKEKQVYDADSN